MAGSSKSLEDKGNTSLCQHGFKRAEQLPLSCGVHNEDDEGPRLRLRYSCVVVDRRAYEVIYCWCCQLRTYLQCMYRGIGK